MAGTNQDGPFPISMFCSHGKSIPSDPFDGSARKHHSKFFQVCKIFAESGETPTFLFRQFP